MNLILIVPLLGSLPLAFSQDLLTLNVYATNAPANALSTVVAKAETYIDILLDAEPSDYIWLEPGEAVPDEDDRRLNTDGSVLAGDAKDPPGTVAASLRGTAQGRGLGMYSCPTTCAKSSSSSCKQLGCAYCGTRCRRRHRERELLLSGGDAALIETTINLLLRPLCLLRLGCSIDAEINRVTWVNGTAIQTPIV